MKTVKALFGILAISAGLAMSGHSQVYHFSTPISGSIGLWAYDSNGPSGSSGMITLNFSNLTETVYVDAVGGIIRQVGTLSYLPSAPNTTFQETQSVSIFPNPPVNVTGSVTIGLGFSGGTLSFDTGPEPVTWDAAAQAYSFNGNLATLGPVNCSWSLTTGGKIYTGSFSYSMQWGGNSGPATTFNLVSLNNYPSSIQLRGLSESPYMWSNDSYNPINISGQTQVAATNGFNMQLVPGSNGGNWGGSRFGWSVNPVTVTATNVPSGAASITNQPQSVVVHAHDTASFSVAASGTVPLSYQWSLNGTNISGAASSALTISSVKQSDLGVYVVVVTNNFGAVTSSNAVLSMYPFIAVPFAGAVTTWGKPASFGVQAWGTGPLSYQWFNNGVAINGATNGAINFASIQFTNGGMYSVVVSSPLGTTTNAASQVIVNPAGVSLGFCPALTISGVTGYSYIIQSSTNLANTNAWVTLTNLTLTQPVQLWVDTNVDASSPFNSQHFYKILPGQ